MHAVRIRTFWLVAGAAMACAPGTPRIDGVVGAPASAAEPWHTPAAARTPPPPPTPPTSPVASAALRADSANVGKALSFSMTDVVALALRNNPATRQSWALAQASVDQYGAARGQLLPTINGSLSFARTSTSGGVGAFGTGGTTGTGVSTGADTSVGGARAGAGGLATTRAQLTPSLSLSYLVFDFGGRAGSIEAARQDAIAADLNHNATLADVVLQVESALFSYQATVALRDAQRTAVAEARADTAAAEARMRVGVGTLADVLQTRTALAQQIVQLATLEGNLLGARATLASTMGLPANARFDVPPMHASDSVVSVAATVDTLVNRAITERPELAAARAQASALAAQIRIARSAGYPALTLSSTGSYAQPFQTRGTTSTRNYSLVLGLQVPIFNGFSRQYDVRAARAEYEAGLARLASTQQQISVEVFTSYAALQAATGRALAARDLLASAIQSADVAAGRYREGVGTIVDVLLARSALATARAEDIQARWEWRTALAQLAHDAGLLDFTGRPNVPLAP